MRVSGTMMAMAASAVLMLSACADQNPNQAAAPQTGQFTGVALPSGYSLDADRSLALGAGDRWIGRIAFTSSMSPTEMFDFFRRDMPKYGWAEGAVVRAQTSLLTFSSSGTARVAVIQIMDRTLGGSRVDMVISPQADGSDGGGGAMPTSRPAPVSAQPLR